MKKRDDVYVSQISERILRIKKHLRGVSRSRFLKSELHRAAVVRELEVIGQAARLVSEETRGRFPQIPWRQIIGMRNRLIHEYFDVDYEIVWDVATIEIPRLEEDVHNVIREIAPPIHPWRNCPLGYYYVRTHPREVASSPANPDGVTSVREHCRRNPSGKDQLYPKEIRWMVENHLRAANTPVKLGTLGDPPNANEFDSIILMWTQYWNEIFSSKDPLDPNLVKALLGSESSFRPGVKDQRISNRNHARGLMQITDETRKIMADETGELKEHFLTLTKDDVKVPEIAAAASVRWLFHKKELAGGYLKREASWEEAVAEYKGYLRKGKDYGKQKGMKRFLDLARALKESIG